ncbi:hypothetical protein VKI22_03575 [Cyanobacterium aponinum UTEX 3221]|uniref:exodeoxyribonuclease X C-terminal domain-containing protein n=1 Tax=Cyanobacterium aponinum TaxID=379064 RepID=UPI002B4C1B3B|nr:hypothetical protein [Cyanobacterium aponinum]WRL39191.1 hypothetical protein VKI22_03575 [Cyanobacterium aponinum UTEX 3221]
MNNIILPFGKYKGRKVNQIIIEDIDYINWLFNQEWLKEKYPLIYIYLEKEFGYWSDIYSDSLEPHPLDNINPFDY